MSPPFEPAYLALWRSGELEQRTALAQQALTNCNCCGWRCRVDRRSDKLGVCRTGVQARVSAHGPHHGEEAPISGRQGSGTIFFSDCSLRCQFCQNYEISQSGQGPEVSAAELAGYMLELQSRGCHNINLVTPTHVGPQILAALWIAAQQGLRIPLVWNSGGYDSPELLALLDGIIDIYLPDMKYANARTALEYSKVQSYPKVNQAAVQIMHRQVGELKLDPDGIAQRGLLVRHLVLPNGLAGTAKIMHFLAQEISPQTYVNLMDQYRPLHLALRCPKLNRSITRKEYEQALQAAHDAGLQRLEQN